MTTKPGAHASSLPIQLAGIDISPAPAATAKVSGGADFLAMMSQFCRAKTPATVSDANPALPQTASPETDSAGGLIDAMLAGETTNSRSGGASAVSGPKSKSGNSSAAATAPTVPDDHLPSLMLALMPQMPQGLPAAVSARVEPITHGSDDAVVAGEANGASYGRSLPEAPTRAESQQAKGALLNAAETQVENKGRSEEHGIHSAATASTQEAATPVNGPAESTQVNNNAENATNSTSPAINLPEHQNRTVANPAPAQGFSVQDASAASANLISTANTASQPAAEAPKRPVAKSTQGRLAAAGTVAALNKSRMNYSAEKNEIAGGNGNKVPGQAEISDSTANNGGKGAPSRSGIVGITGRKKEVLDSSLVQDAPLKASSATPSGLSLTPESKAATTNVASVDRVARMVNQEVVMVRQSGARTLAVALKVDPQTELLLHVSNHNGQIQASISCERGNIDNLSAHWQQLQESLSRQNIHLMPLEGRTGTAAPVIASNSANTQDAPTNGGGTFNFKQSPQDAERQPAEARGQNQAQPKAARASSVASKNQKNNNPGQKGWETWA